MKQLTLGAVGFERYAKTTRRAGIALDHKPDPPGAEHADTVEPDVEDRMSKQAQPVRAL
jgi:hypothetical protein